MSEVGDAGQLAVEGMAPLEESDGDIAVVTSAPSLRGLEEEEASYDALREPLRDLAATTRAATTFSLAAGGIKVHSVTSRVKEFNSAYDKASARGCAISGLRDLVGVRVVCLYQSDLERVDAVISGTFSVLSRDDKRDASPVDSFGYMSIHYDCQLPQQGIEGLGNVDDLLNYTFEVQTRTILMDAWANVSHHLAYKGEASMPSEVAREFHALSGLLYVADQALDGVFDAAERSRLRALGGPDPNDPIDRDTLRGLLRMEFTDRRDASSHAYATLADDLAEAGYRSLSAVQSDLLAGKSGFQRWARRYAENDNFTDAAVARKTLAIANAVAARVLYPGVPDTTYRYRQSRQV